jgi:hypothetical protein
VEEAQSAAQAQPNKFTSFAHLYIRPAGVYTSGQLGSVVRYCPSLVDIYIEIKTGLTDTDLFCLKSLKNLHSLKFIRHQSGSNRKEITFDKGLAPVLKVIGNSLKVLYLVYFEFIDIWTVVKFCPNLMSLTFDNHCQSLSALSENEIIQLRHEKGRGYFQSCRERLIDRERLSDRSFFCERDRAIDRTNLSRARSRANGVERYRS